MKTIGLIGGTSWVSTVEYYSIINKLVNERLGGVNSARLYLHSVNFEEFRPKDDSGDWDRIAREFIDIAHNLSRDGAECLALCANTPHMVADIIQDNISIPLIHIVEAVAVEIKKSALNNVGLLGTSFTMEKEFYKSGLLQHGIKTIIPNKEDRAYVHSSIFGELGQGIFSAETKSKYKLIIEDLKDKGAQGVIFGCTEIPLLLNQDDCSIPVFDTTYIHAKAIVDFALS